MHSEYIRVHGRRYDQLREIKIHYNAFGYAPGSILFELGNTKILCSVTMQPGVPPFLKGTKTGWLTAEYAMLPTSTHQRSVRETVSKRNERAIEISRFIGRALRCMVNLAALGERTIIIDCDVLQADGSTRTAAITGSSIALKVAVQHWLSSRQLQENIIQDWVAAVSVGYMQGNVLLDLDYHEDSMIDADYNFVITESNKIIEIQGTAEKTPLTCKQFDLLKDLAFVGSKKLFQSINEIGIPMKKIIGKEIKVPLFSLKNRLENSV